MRVSQSSIPNMLPRLWRSPIRGPWLTSVFGMALLVGIPIEFLTGAVSWAAYDPRLAGNDTTRYHGVLSFYLFDWITSPSWIYRVSQGTHVCSAWPSRRFCWPSCGR